MIEAIAKAVRYNEQINNMSKEELEKLPLEAWISDIEFILDEAEKLGMLPPSCYNFHYKKSSELYKEYINEWEPE